MKHFIVGLLFCVQMAAFASAWQVRLIDQESIAPVGYYRLLRFEKPPENPVYINVVMLKKNSYKAILADQYSRFGFLFKPNVYSTTKKNRALLGINGGYFTPDDQPLGLMILNSRVVSRLSHSPLLTGMVVISASGKLSLMRRQTLKTRPMYAFQAGPFLIRGSWLYRRQTQKAERRTVLAMTKRGDVLVLSASDVTLTTLAKILKTTGDALSDSAITVALNLDGGSSTAMTLRVPKKRSIVVPEVFPVRSALLFFSKV